MLEAVMLLFAIMSFGGAVALVVVGILTIHENMVDDKARKDHREHIAREIIRARVHKRALGYRSWEHGP